MDKKNTFIGILLIIAAILSFVYTARHAPVAPRPPVEIGGNANPFPANQAQPGGSAPATSPGDATFAAVSKEDAAAAFVTLGNDYIEATFTSAGGAIQKVALKKHAAVYGRPEPFEFNAVHVAPALSIDDFPELDTKARYTLVSKNDTTVVYRTVLDGRIEVTRTYTVHAPGDASGDPYQIRTATTFRNLTDKVETLPRLALNLGTSSPIDANDLGFYLDVGYYDGSSASFVNRTSMEPGFLSRFGIGNSTPASFIERPGSTVWASVKNQFFTGILTPDEPGTGVIVRRVELPPFPGNQRPDIGITGSAFFELKPIAAGGQAVLGASYYVGPKEYRRLAATDNFKHGEDKVMEFTKFFGFFSQILLTMMTWVHSHVVANWGLAIIITTLILKTVFMPLTISASRSSKHMAKLQPHMQAMREKYKDNPQKLQTETMKLFKENNVNPVGGCIPILITIPFFFGFFSMLRSASELRFAEFLWVHDLSAPDTVGHLFGFPINIMPLLMGVTSVIQMRLMPTPTVDNAQAKMMKFMPYMFIFFCYSYSCALAIYWTVNNTFTIFQQIIINRMPEPVLPALAADAKAVKNVTPKKKK